jgi:hypothetical protein
MGALKAIMPALVIAAVAWWMVRPVNWLLLQPVRSPTSALEGGGQFRCPAATLCIYHMRRKGAWENYRNRFERELHPRFLR